MIPNDPYSPAGRLSVAVQQTVNAASGAWKASRRDSSSRRIEQSGRLGVSNRQRSDSVDSSFMIPAAREAFIIGQFGFHGGCVDTRTKRVIRENGVTEITADSRKEGKRA